MCASVTAHAVQVRMCSRCSHDLATIRCLFVAASADSRERTFASFFRGALTRALGTEGPRSAIRRSAALERRLGILCETMH